MVQQKRKIIGTLVPIFSLRSNQLAPKDQGTFAAAALFLDWLKKNNQSAWQILPINERQLEKGSVTKHVPSPYKGYGIGLSSSYLPQAFKNVYPSKNELKEFEQTHKEWIADYAFFCAARDHFKTDDWRKWDEALRAREGKAIAHWKQKLATQIQNYVIEQWQLHQSYEVVRMKARQMGIKLIGDMPYYISINSPLVWANQEVFCLGKDCETTAVSGIPDTPGTHFGRQIWGHPLYNWSNEKRVIAFWKMRLRYQAVLFDILRFDHAKAFFAYGSIDPQNPLNDRYKDGPGEPVLRELMAFCKDMYLEVFVEDSGDRTEELKRALHKLHIAGLRIFWFALKRNIPEINYHYADVSRYPVHSVAYTTTHDTETLLGYLESLRESQKRQLAAAAELRFSKNDRIFAETIREAIVASPSYIVILPIQDWVLTKERINIPGTEKEIDDPNWRYTIHKPLEELPEIA